MSEKNDAPDTMVSQVRQLWLKMFVGNHEPSLLVRIRDLERDMTDVERVQTEMLGNLKTLVSAAERQEGRAQERIEQDARNKSKSARNQYILNTLLAILTITISILAVRVEMNRKWIDQQPQVQQRQENR